MLRERTHLKLDLGAKARQGLRLLTGALMGVFGKRPGAEQYRISTPTATIGIRGTGIYAESEPDRTYLCTCYGSTQIAPAGHEHQSAQVTASHHDHPRWVLPEPAEGHRIVPAPMYNHNDLELMTLEALVGREAPFGETGRIMVTPRLPR